MSPEKAKRVLVIGGTKFIGPHVVARLCEIGHCVTAYHRGETEAKLPSSVRHVHSPSAGIPVVDFPRELMIEHFDVVVHMIAMGERDSEAALSAFRDRVQRIVWISSGDVYRAYGRFTGLEPGPVECDMLTERSPARSVLYPYRSKAISEQDLSYWYEKILVERVALSELQTPGVVLRLPKAYRPGDEAEFFRFRKHPQWRWTHGRVEDVAEAIVLAAIHPHAIGRIYNVGEQYTPTIGERLSQLAAAQDLADDYDLPANFDQNIVFDTSRIRHELGFSEVSLRPAA